MQDPRITSYAGGIITVRIYKEQRSSVDFERQ